MPNKRKINSTVREVRLVNELRAQGYFSLRAPSSLGVADVIAIRPAAKMCSDPTHFQVRFIQVKTSQDVREKKVVLKSEELPFGFVNVEWHHFPVKNAHFWEEHKKRKLKELTKKKKAKLKAAPKTSR